MTEPRTAAGRMLALTAELPAAGVKAILAIEEEARTIGFDEGVDVGEKVCAQDDHHGAVANLRAALERLVEAAVPVCSILPDGSANAADVQYYEIEPHHVDVARAALKEQP